MSLSESSWCSRSVCAWTGEMGGGEVVKGDCWGGERW
jgi:hypothetical protein